MPERQSKRSSSRGASKGHRILGWSSPPRGPPLLAKGIRRDNRILLGSPGLDHDVAHKLSPLESLRMEGGPLRVHGATSRRVFTGVANLASERWMGQNVGPCPTVVRASLSTTLS